MGAYLCVGICRDIQLAYEPGRVSSEDILDCVKRMVDPTLYE